MDSFNLNIYENTLIVDTGIVILFDLGFFLTNERRDDVRPFSAI